MEVIEECDSSENEEKLRTVSQKSKYREMNQKVKNHKFFWNLKSPWATPHSGRSNRSSNRSGVTSPSTERTRNQLSPSCGSIAPKRRKGSILKFTANENITQIVSYVHSKRLIFW